MDISMAFAMIQVQIVDLNELILRLVNTEQEGIRLDA